METQNQTVQDDNQQIVSEWTETEKAKNYKYLTFPIQKEEYGIDIQYITEIVGIQGITEVPDMEPFIKGVINLRGQVIPVLDIRIKFGMEEKEYNDRTCIIVVVVEGLSVGLIVDTVSEVVDISSNQIDKTPKIASSDSAKYFKGIGKVDDRVIILFDIKRLLYRDKIKVFDN